MEKSIPLFLPALAAICAATVTANAEIKYWDNPEFKAYDVDSYVQRGLELHYDGIRNAGADLPHDPAATTWKNLGSGGSAYDMKRYSLVSGAWAAGDATGKWTDSGFVFAKDAVFWEPTDVTLPTALTHQVLLDATSADQAGIGYPVCGQAASQWSEGGSVGIRSNGTIANTMYFTPLNNTDGNAKYRPAISGTSFTYGTAILNAKAAVMFAGTKAPWTAASTGGTSGHYVNSAYTPAVRTISGGLCLGGHYRKDGADASYKELFKGTLKSYRFYSRALEDDEVAWNRVLDEYRYFGKVVGIPVTNAVVTANYPLVSGDTPNGAYAVDASGYVFSAPASKVVNGRTYTLAGHTVEAFSGGAWTVVEDSDAAGAASVAVSASDAVRITWKWTKGGGLVSYDVDDYVQKGLLLHYDGIRNVGAGKPHDSSARQWQNVAPGNPQWPMDWFSYVPNSGGGYQYTRGDFSRGAWADDGFAFDGYGYFAKWEDTPAFSVPAQFTMQFALDGSFADLAWTTQYLFLPSTGYAKGSVGLRKNNYNAVLGNANSVYMIDITAFPDARPNFYPTNKKLTYANFVVDSEAGHAFEGTAPTDAETANVSVSASPARSLSWFCVGGFHNKSTAAGTSLECFKGTIHDFRLYDHALDEAELAQNRKVDDWRYFGIVSTTNVFVQSTYSYLPGNEETGPYEVDGAYTFTAPESVTAENGVAYECDGYTLETWNGTEWTGATAGTGNSYAYTTAAGQVRLTWKWKAVSGLRTAADYSYDDLSQAGLALHYDGKFNAGVGVARSTTATKWVNLGAAGSPMDLSAIRASSDTTSAWGDKGYEYAGYTYFQSAVNTYVWGGSYSAQILADAKHADNTHASGNYLAASTWNRFGMQDYGYSKLARSNVQGTGDNTQRVSYPTEDGIDYMTVIADAAAKVDYAFAGTTIPTGVAATAGYRPYATQLAPYSNYFRLGGWGGGNNGQGLTGTIFTFRYYDRVLTAEELVRNRNVDAARYFGALGVTNVVVEVEDGSGIVPAETAGEAYFVEGSHVFTATGSAGLGYRVSVPDGEGGWTVKAIAEGGSFAYDKSDTSTPALVKLEWRVRKPLVLVVR